MEDEAVTISPEHRFQHELNLGSRKSERVVTRLAEELGVRVPGFATALSQASLREVAESFAEQVTFGGDRLPPTRVGGVDRWVRRFEVVPAALEARPAAPIEWHEIELASPNFADAEGLLVRLPPRWDALRDAPPLLRLCQQAASRYRHLALRHDGAPLSGFARSIAAEGLFESVRLIEGEATSALLQRQVQGFEEIARRADGSPGMPQLVVRAQTNEAVSGLPGTILVTGGARGIAAECARRLATRHGNAMILVGRTAADSSDVAKVVEGLAGAGIDARYVQADVTDRRAMPAGVSAAAAELGPITLLIHAAGVNEPASFTSIDEAMLERAMAAKTAGLVVAIDACGPSLRRVVTFGSIIGRLGLAGEAHYALANAEQTRLLAEIASRRPALSTLAIEWSVWSAVGMGERLGAIDRLDSAGVDALSLDDALDEFECLALGDSEGAIVVSSRFGSDAPVRLATPLRFAERKLVHTPGVELVVEPRISHGRDPYVGDHSVDGDALMPAVMLLEAMTQGSHALEPAAIRAFDQVKFAAGIGVDNADLPLRIAVLRDPGGGARAEIRTAADDFRGLRVSAALRHKAVRWPAAPAPVAMESDTSALYGPLFFHGPRFRRLAAIGGVSSRDVHATFKHGSNDGWFGAFEPQTLLLGDPGLRDAALHVLQCCVPHRRVIPVSAKRIAMRDGGTAERLHAKERWSRDGAYCFDILLVDGDDRVVEYWLETVFKSIGEIDIAPVLAATPALTRPYLERRAREEAGDDTLVLALIEAPGATRDERRRRAAVGLGLSGAPHRRGDGCPIGENGRQFSFSHCGDMTIGVSASRRVGCDLERVAEFAAEELAQAWVSEESLRKLGSRASLTSDGEGRYTGAAGEQIVSIGPIQGANGPVAVSVGTAGE